VATALSEIRVELTEQAHDKAVFLADAYWIFAGRASIPVDEHTVDELDGRSFMHDPRLDHGTNLIDRESSDPRFGKRAHGAREMYPPGPGRGSEDLPRDSDVVFAA
jgi:hypothetical protein